MAIIFAEIRIKLFPFQQPHQSNATQPHNAAQPEADLDRRSRHTATERASVAALILSLPTENRTEPEGWLQRARATWNPGP